MGISAMKSTEKLFDFVVEWKQSLSHTWEKLEYYFGEILLVECFLLLKKKTPDCKESDYLCSVIMHCQGMP